MNDKPETPQSLLERLTPVLQQAGSAEERRVLLAAALTEHRRQGLPLFRARRESGGLSLKQGLSLGLARAAAEGASVAVRQQLQPLAQQQPWLLLAVAGTAGVLFALSRPQRLVRWGWRWVRPVLGLELSNAVHGYLRQGLRKAFVSAVRQGVTPSTDRPAPRSGLS